mgnify:FL=1
MSTAVYRDIMYLPRPASKHIKMSLQNRAKLFAPFAALRGFDIEILTKEGDTLLSPRPELSESQEEEIFRTLNSVHRGSSVVLVRFLLAKIVDGTAMGSFVTISGEVSKIEEESNCIVVGKELIPLSDVLALRFTA